MVRSRRSPEKESFWRLVLEEHRQSGLSVRAFCQREGISAPSFYAWRRKLQQNASTASSTAGTAEKQLIPVKVVQARSESQLDAGNDVAEIVTPGGFTLRVPLDIQPQELRGLLNGIASVTQEAASC